MRYVIPDMIDKFSIHRPASYKNSVIFETDTKKNFIYGLNDFGKSILFEYLSNPNDSVYSNCCIEPILTRSRNACI